MEEREIQTHLSHCFQGDYDTTCKYGEDDICPANPLNQMYLTGITLKEQFRSLPKNLTIHLNPVTLLVGEQGCGKSSLLSLLQENNTEYLDLKLSVNIPKGGVTSYYFDSEKMNPRIQSLNEFSNPNGTSKGIGLGNGLMSRFKSHGETLRRFTVDNIHKSKDSVVLLDEPESGLSLRNQYKLINSIKETSKNNKVQFIIATHSLILIQSVDYVYSLEHKKWMESKEFIELNKTV